MSVKGKGQVLFVGRQSVSIRDWLYNTTTIKYVDVTKIEYCYCTMTEGGYMDFHSSLGDFKRFCFPKKSNAHVQKAVEYITEHCPELDIDEHDPNTDPFYSKNIFIAVLSVFFLFMAYRHNTLLVYWEKDVRASDPIYGIDIATPPSHNDFLELVHIDVV